MACLHPLQYSFYSRKHKLFIQYVDSRTNISVVIFPPNSGIGPPPRIVNIYPICCCSFLKHMASVAVSQSMLLHRQNHWVSGNNIVEGTDCLPLERIWFIANVAICFVPQTFVVSLNLCFDFIRLLLILSPYNSTLDLQPF